ncbi:alpha/beta fold hydrolase [Corynebacterium hylobatis]|uniref:alpha/beta fold hydrolase n=1 Tax=Corynebacterium hylobatis TaxID=1859290 RepID=UPI0019D0BFCA|nr:alpha/beta fold hydrolase [Corynebacterium hylobatis]
MTRPPESRRRRILAWLAFTSVSVVAIASTTALLLSGPEVGHWRSAGVQATYAQAHAELIAQLPAQPELLDVPVTHGTVRVLHWPGGGDGAEQEPVLLIPGRSSGSAQWVENLPGWIGTRPIYAPDPLGDAGFSAQRLPFTGIGDQADAWAEVMDGLGIDAAHVVGHSFGAAQAANLAVRHPERIRSLALFEPVMVLDSPPASVYFWATVASLPLPAAWREEALARIGGTTADEVRGAGPMAALIDAATKGYAAALPTPGVLPEEQWRALTTPVRVDLGGRQSLSGSGAAERARELLPQATVTVWPEGTHSLPMDQRADFDLILPRFWAEAGSAATGD